MALLLDPFFFYPFSLKWKGQNCIDRQREKKRRKRWHQLPTATRSALHKSGLAQPAPPGHLADGCVGRLTVMEDFPAVFPCFSKDLDSFLWETICTRKRKMEIAVIQLQVLVKFPLQILHSALPETMTSMCTNFPRTFHKPLLKTGIPLFLLWHVM